MTANGVPRCSFRTQSRPLFLSHFGETFPAEEFHESWVRHFWVIAETRLTLKRGALELLDLLDRLGLPRAIATSSSHRTIKRHLTAYDLTSRFDAVAAIASAFLALPGRQPIRMATMEVVS